MREPNEEKEYRAGLDTAHGGNLLTPSENFCLWCKADISAEKEFCNEYCENRYEGQRRAERKLK
jgi:hypothetical protein